MTVRVKEHKESSNERAYPCRPARIRKLNLSNIHELGVPAMWMLVQSTVPLLCPYESVFVSIPR
jgi:hypothetical protein